MNPQTDKPLRILSASAGSGKTYNLVLTFLRLMMDESVSIDAFSGIIAMTFTNKAAAEMKYRIIKALDSLSSVDEKDVQAQTYLEEVSSKLAIPKEKINVRSGLILKSILHQYEQFHILTIDKFNLRLIRSFSRDLNINNDFHTTTEEGEVMQKLVDRLFSEINLLGNDQLTKVAIELSKERLLSEEAWDFKKDLNEFVQILLKENNFPILEHIRSQSYSISSYFELKKQLEELKKEINEHALTFYDFLMNTDCSNIPGKTVTTKQFVKLLNFEEQSDINLVTENCRTKLETFEATSQATQAFYAFYDAHIVDFFRLKLYLKNYFFIALLKELSVALVHFKQSENVVLLSEFNSLIANLLKEESAPYIYERIGNRFKHYLLDEFQDTSRLQWLNLLPLIHDSLGSKRDNLIVGDPKQSIYRFKNGLAEQFVALPGIYNPENDARLSEISSFFVKMGIQDPLQENYRSRKEIVEFNNLFFSTLKVQQSTVLKDFYEDIIQLPKKEDGGYISLYSEMLKKGNDNVDENEGESDEENEYPFLLAWIEECLADGFKPNDICILDLKKNDGNKYASYLLKNGYQVVSTDSLLLGENKEVKLVMAYLKWRAKPSSETDANFFIEKFLDYTTEDVFSAIKQFWKTTEHEGKSYTSLNPKSFITHFFKAEHLFFVHYENMYQLVQSAFNILNLDEKKSAYLTQFADYAFQYDQNLGLGLNSFVDEFENSGRSKPVTLPENENALIVLTAHKSKGLEFPVVLLPSLNWRLTLNNTKYLIQDEEFVFYTTLSENSFIPAIRQANRLENEASLLDKINLLYVAFTRPIHRLYVRNVFSSNETFPSIVHQTLKEIGSPLDEKLHIHIGERKPYQREKKESRMAFRPSASTKKLWFPDIALREEEWTAKGELSDERRFGKQLHELLAMAEYKEQIPKALMQGFEQGKFEKEFENDLKRYAESMLSDSFYLQLVEGAISLKREQDIVINEKESKRPDLIICKETETVIVDYKSGIEEAKHVKQVKQYMELVKKMNFPEVRGYVCYTLNQKWVEC